MSLDFLLITGSVDDKRYAKLYPLYRIAHEHQVIREESRVVFERWHKHPISILPILGVKDGWDMNDFIQAFEVGSYIKNVGVPLISVGSPVEVHADWSNIIIFSRIQPMALLWYALGSNLAEKLPGFMGNMLISSQDVPEHHELVRKIYDLTTPEKLIDKAKELINENYSGLDDEIEQVLMALPTGLEKALKEGKGFMSLSMMLP